MSFPIRRESQSSLLGQFRPIFPRPPNAFECRVNTLSFGDRVAQFAAISPKGMPNPYEFALRLCLGPCSRIFALPLASSAPSVQSADNAAVSHRAIPCENPIKLFRALLFGQPCRETGESRF